MVATVREWFACHLWSPQCAVLPNGRKRASPAAVHLQASNGSMSMACSTGSNGTVLPVHPGQSSSEGARVREEPLARTEAAAPLTNAARVKEKLREKMSHDAAAYGTLQVLAKGPKLHFQHPPCQRLQWHA